MRTLRTLLLLGILLLGFGLRVFRLDGQSFWSDEGASVFMTGRSFGEILAAAAGDIHPPLYYLLLRYWSDFVGTSEFAVRFLSLFFGVLLVVLVFKLGQKLAGHNVGLAAAFLAATSPFLIYYSQEARMYAQMATLSALSVLLAMSLFKRIESREGIVTSSLPFALYTVPYIIVTSAALYTQYFAFTIVLFENVLFVLIFWRFWRSWRTWLVWAVIQIAVVILYVPWLGQVIGQLNTWPSISEPLSLQTLVYRVFLVFSFGLSWDVTTTTKTQALFAALVVLGIAQGLRVKGRGLRVEERLSPPLNPLPSTLYSLLYLAVPIGVMYYLSLKRPMFNPKFLLLATPPFYVLLGLGVIALKEAAEAAARFAVRIPRAPLFHVGLAAIVAFLALGGTVFATNRSLDAYYFDSKYGRDDYRGLSRQIEASARPGDAIILNAPGQVEIFGYYYKGTLPVLPLPRQRPLDEKVTGEDLEEAVSKYQRIWVVFWAERESDPRGFVESWLNQNTFRASNRWYGSVRLVLYGVPTNTQAGVIQQQIDANLGNKVSLLGYSLSGGGDSTGGGSAKPGEVLQLTLFWQALSKVEDRYVVFTHLLDPHEHIWGQRDAEPGSGAKPTTTWAPGAVIADNYGIPVVPGTPPGEYYVEVGLYQPATGQRLQVLGRSGEVTGDRVLFGPVSVAKADVPPTVESLSVEHPTSVDLGPLHLVGFELYKLGTERGNVDFRRGDIAHLGLVWQAGKRPGKDYNVVVRLLDRNGQIVFTKQNAPADGNYPTASWDNGEIVLDQHKLPLDLPPGSYGLVVGIDDGRGMVKAQGAKAQGEMVELATVDVR